MNRDDLMKRILEKREKIEELERRLREVDKDLETIYSMQGILRRNCLESDP